MSKRLLEVIVPFYVEEDQTQRISIPSTEGGYLEFVTSNQNGGFLFRGDVSLEAAQHGVGENDYMPTFDLMSNRYAKGVMAVEPNLGIVTLYSPGESMRGYLRWRRTDD